MLSAQEHLVKARKLPAICRRWPIPYSISSPAANRVQHPQHSLAGLLAAAKPLIYLDLGIELRTESPNLISAAKRVIANFLRFDLT
jgi:hypothetical protein